MTAAPQRYDLDRVLRLGLTLLTIAAVVWLLVILSDVLIPFAVAILLAYLLNPVVNAFEERTGHRGAAVALTLAVLSALLAVTVPLVSWLVIKESIDAVEVLSSPELRTRLTDRFAPLLQWLEDHSVREQVREKIRQQIDQMDPQELQRLGSGLLHWLVQRGGGLLGAAAGLLGGVFNAILACSALVVILLYMIFLMLDFNSFQARWREHLPPAYREPIASFVNEFSDAMGRYFRGQFLVALISGVLLAIGFRIVGLRLSVVMGLLIGMLNMVPYLQVVGLIPALFLALLRGLESGGWLPGPLLATLAVFGVVQLIQDSLLVPRIMGQSTGLRPWVMLLSVFVWGKLLGFLGLTLAIPLSCLGLAYYRRFILKIPSAQAEPPEPC